MSRSHTKSALLFGGAILIGFSALALSAEIASAKGRTERLRVFRTDAGGFTHQMVVKQSDLAAAIDDGWVPLVGENARGGRRGGVVRGGGGGQNPVVNGRSGGNNRGGPNR